MYLDFVDCVIYFPGDLTKLSFDRNLGHPYTITVYEDYIYWTDRKLRSLMRFAKNGTGHVENMRDSVGSVHDIHAVVPDRQKGKINLLISFSSLP